MELSFVVSSFIAGLLIFLAPCTFSLVPGYLAFISGVSPDDLKNQERSKSARRKIFLNGLFFILGFSAVFVIMGTLVGFVGASVLAPYRIWLSRIGGVFVIIFGLFMLNAIKISFLSGERQFRTPIIFTRGKPVNSFILGSAFAFGWTPCVGPILGSILFVASTSATAFQGAFLLSIFSLGLAIPFLLIAFGIGSAANFIRKISSIMNVVSVAGGMLLIILGTFLLTGKMAFFIAWAYHIFQFIEYDRLLDYL